MLIEAEDQHFSDLIAGAAPAGLRVAENGLESAETLTMLQGLAAAVREGFSPAAWLMVEDGEIVGLCSLLGPPCAVGIGAIGYGVAASRRRQGVATRAIAELLHWAQLDIRISAITAETSVDNQPSQRVLEANGFRRTGVRTDSEDGDLLCWRWSIDDTDNQ